MTPPWLVNTRKGAALGHVRDGNKPALDALLARAANDGTESAILAHLKEREPALSFAMVEAGVGRWGAAPWQQAVMNDESGRVLVRGGNKIGKTAVISESLALYFEGRHPVWKLPVGRPASVLYIAADLKNVYGKDVCRRLHEFIPESRWAPGVTWSRQKGFMFKGGRAFEHVDGHEIMFGSGTQDGAALTGMSADVVIINEPPIQHRWGEIMRAAAEWEAPALVGFTPIDSHGVSRNIVWLKNIVEGTPSEAEADERWQQHVIHLSEANAPHRTPESIAQQIADMPHHERQQRQFADWEGPAPLRTLRSFGPSNVFDFVPGQWDMLPDYNKDHDLYLRLSADHGELEKKEVWGLIAYQTAEGSRAWALDEYVADGATSFLTDAQGVLAMLARHGLSFGAIDEAFGDTNSAGKSHLKKMNQVFEAEFKALTGIHLRIQNAAKGPGSVGMGTINLNNAFATNRLWISVLAAQLRRSCDRWDGRPKDENKDAVDMLRYGVNDLFAPVRGNVRRIARG